MKISIAVFCVLVLTLAFGHARLMGEDKEKPAEEPKEQTVEAYDSTTKGALQVNVNIEEPSDWFDVLQEGKRVLKGEPPLLNQTIELPPGAYVVEVNKTQRKVTIEAGQKTILLTGQLLVQGKSKGDDPDQPGLPFWYAMQGKQMLTATGVEPLLNKTIPLFAGTYTVFVDTSLTGQDKSFGKTEVKPGRKTVLKH